MVQNHEVKQPQVEFNAAYEVGSRVLAACMMEGLTPEEVDRERWLADLPSTD